MSEILGSLVSVNLHSIKVKTLNLDQVLALNMTLRDKDQIPWDWERPEDDVVR